LRAFLVGVVILSVALASAQDRTEIRQTLRDLSSAGVLMDISAHPDDEDGATLAYYRMKHGVHTYSVLFTRGEGGQNEKGPELYEELGVIRSQETHAAGALLGTEVEFLNFPDFGYSKTATEAFRVWSGQRELLRRLVYVIRRMKPDILFSNHGTWGGHGHHQAAAITAIAAFDAAADSSMFPEQLQEPGVDLWQPRKLYLRVFNPSPGTADVTHNLEEVNDIRGVAYIDVATAALRKHRTQGLDRLDLRAFGRVKSAYRLARASSLFREDSTNFFGGIRIWDEEPLASIKPLADDLSQIRMDDSWEGLVATASHMLLRVDSLRHTPAGASPLGRRVLERWRERLEHLAAIAAGVEATPVSSDSVLVPGQRVRVTIRPTALRGHITVKEVRWELPGGWSVQPEGNNDGEAARTFTLTVSERPRLSFPRAEHLYRSIEDGSARIAHIVYGLKGWTLTLDIPCTADVAAPHLLNANPDVVWAQPEDAVRGLSFTARVTNMFPHKSAGTVTIAAPAGWRGSGFNFTLDREGDADQGIVQLVAPAGVAEGDYAVRLKTDYADRKVLVRLAKVSVAPGLRVGLISSYDSTIATSLRELHVACDTLNDAALAGADLRVYNTILIDMRAYLVREALRQQNSRLLRYVNDGGHLVVMYQREREWKPEYAPYPFGISRDRVTMENAPVVVLQKSHPLMCWPNAIRPHDWDGWTQERLVYLPESVPAAYTRIISTHDPDEPGADTGYLCASSGNGSYIYTTYVWYRQLKDRHPGALRCFANMISYPLRSR
jgi:LmbE family N-acetylglucosaminyl deacetylase